MLKCDEKFLWLLLSLTQEGNFKAGRFALISADELIIAHSNEAEYRSLIANKKNEALHSRIIVMPVPYNLRHNREERIYEKRIKESVEGFSPVDVNSLKNEFSDEGMDGIDPRYVINRISSAISRKDIPSINALDVLRSLKDGLDQHPSISKEDKEKYMNYISVARKE